MDSGQWALLSRDGSIPIRMVQFSSDTGSARVFRRAGPRHASKQVPRDEILSTNENGSCSRSGGKLVHRSVSLSKNGSDSSTCYLTKDQGSLRGDVVNRFTIRE